MKPSKKKFSKSNFGLKKNVEKYLIFREMTDQPNKVWIFPIIIFSPLWRTSILWYQLRKQLRLWVVNLALKAVIWFSSLSQLMPDFQVEIHLLFLCYLKVPIPQSSLSTK